MDQNHHQRTGTCSEKITRKQEPTRSDITRNIQQPTWPMGDTPRCHPLPHRRIPVMTFTFPLSISRTSRLTDSSRLTIIYAHQFLGGYPPNFCLQCEIYHDPTQSATPILNAPPRITLQPMSVHRLSRSFHQGERRCICGSTRIPLHRAAPYVCDHRRRYGAASR